MTLEPWHYDKAEDLDQTMVERLGEFPRRPDILVYGTRMLTALMIRGWLRTYNRLKISGREHLPREGSYVLVANHASHLDTLSILSALPLGKLHHVFPAAAKDFFFVSVPRVAVAALVVNALPFDRKANARQSLGLCREILAGEGNVLLLFPEGTRSMTGELGEFKPGIGLLLAGMDCPVVPCHLDGAFESLPKGGRFPRPRKIHLKIGEPLNYKDLKRGKKSALRICEELHEAVSRLAPSYSSRSA